MSWFDKANRRSAISFFIWCTNLALPEGFHGNFRIAVYNLYLHSIYAFVFDQSESRKFTEYIIRLVIVVFSFYRKNNIKNV